MCRPPTGIEHAKPVTPQPPSASGDLGNQGPAGRRPARARRNVSGSAEDGVLWEDVFRLELVISVLNLCAGKVFATANAAAKDTPPPPGEPS